MKAIKLFIVFILMLALVVGVVFLSGSGGGGTTGPENTKYIEKVNKYITDNWQEEWTREKFDDTQDFIDAYRKELGSSYGTMNEKFYILALKSIYDTMIAEYANPQADKKVIDNLNKDLVYFKDSSRITDHKDIKTLEDIYKLYNKAIDFSKRNFRYKVQYISGADADDIKEDKMLWADIYMMHEKDDSERVGILKDENYQYIKNIVVISSALNSSSFKEKTATARESFMNQLVKAIVDDFASRFNNDSLDSFGRCDNEEDYKIYCQRLENWSKHYNNLLEIRKKFSMYLSDNNYPEKSVVKGELESFAKEYKSQLEQHKNTKSKVRSRLDSRRDEIKW